MACNLNISLPNYAKVVAVAPLAYIFVIVLDTSQETCRACCFYTDLRNTICPCPTRCKQY